MFNAFRPPARTAQKGRMRLAIISTYDELCGIAGYTRALVKQLEPLMDVTVFDLDQYLLRSPHRRVQRMGDRHIRDIAARLAEFDCVNIQLEHGTLGRMPSRILYRFRLLAKAAPALSVTFHTVLSDDGMPWEQIWRHTRRGRVDRAASAIGDALRATLLSRGMYQFLRRLQRRRHVHLITHTRRDMRLLRDVFRLQNVHHHPLSFVDAGRAAEIRAVACRADFPGLRRLPPDARLIGTFGFLSPYKGFDVAIRALQQLPANHHLLIFGGVHPQTIRRNEAIDPYIAQLLGTGRIGETMLAELSEAGRSGISIEAAAADLVGRHPRDIGDRVHFMGVLGDDQFMSAMAICDVVALPYLEVGQSSSGPLSMAVEMGCHVIASRNLAFLQYARYHPHALEFFDIGNFHELAQRIAALEALPAHRPPLAFNTDTNAALYLRANSPAGVDSPPPSEAAAARGASSGHEA
jgi:glycosyltransferase involved in cell wall biosynthesis